MFLRREGQGLRRPVGSRRKSAFHGGSGILHAGRHGASKGKERRIPLGHVGDYRFSDFHRIRIGLAGKKFGGDRRILPEKAFHPCDVRAGVLLFEVGGLYRGVQRGNALRHGCCVLAGFERAGRSQLQLQGGFLLPELDERRRVVRGPAELLLGIPGDVELLHDAVGAPRLGGSVVERPARQIAAPRAAGFNNRARARLGGRGRRLPGNRRSGKRVRRKRAAGARHGHGGRRLDFAGDWRHDPPRLQLVRGSRAFIHHTGAQIGSRVRYLLSDNSRRGRFRRGRLAGVQEKLHPGRAGKLDAWHAVRVRHEADGRRPRPVRLPRRRNVRLPRRRNVRLLRRRNVALRPETGHVALARHVGQLQGRRRRIRGRQHGRRRRSEHLLVGRRGVQARLVRIQSQKLVAHVRAPTVPASALLAPALPEGENRPTRPATGRHGD